MATPEKVNEATKNSFILRLHLVVLFSQEIKQVFVLQKILQDFVLADVDMMSSLYLNKIKSKQFRSQTIAAKKVHVY